MLDLAAPPGVTATRSDVPYSTEEQIDIRRDTGLVCRALFAARAVPASADSVRRLADSDAWRDDLRRRMALVFDQVEVERFPSGAVVGAVTLGSDAGSGYANIVYTFETAPGRTTLFCAAPINQLRAERTAIDVLARSISLPGSPQTGSGSAAEP